MRLLLDTHVVLWAATAPNRLSEDARLLLADPANELWFSAVSLWEIAIKQGLQRPDFRGDARLLRRGLFENGYRELVITGRHALAVLDLPPLHKDPFDRMLIGQSIVEGVTLVTADRALARYSAPLRLV